MRFIDRLTGLASELPDRPVPGRHAAACAMAEEGLQPLRPGDPLLDDGSGVCRWEGGRREFAKIESDPDRMAEAELTADAIRAIAATSRLGIPASPLLPAEVASQCELLPLETRLGQVLGKGHLHSISKRPRIDVRYEEAVVDVGRARRMAKGALTHLTSHSDCWQRKTPGGIEPRRILGRFSEDDYSTYENRLYARLLEALERHLAARIAKVRGLKEQLEAALEFQHSDRTHHRLLHRVCGLWGEAFHSDGSASLEASQATFGTLVRQLKAIRGLKQQGLYAEVPRSAQVGGQVHRTNILNHDPHYRHLPPLWEHLRERRAEALMRPEEALAKARQDHDDYSEYVGLALRRALDHWPPVLENGGFRFRRPGGEGRATRKGADWLLEADGAEPLRVVPLFWFGGLDADTAVPEGTVVCTPEVPEDAPSWLVRVSPMDLHVVERLGKALDRWLLKGPASRYGRPIGRVPTPVAKLLEGWGDAAERHAQPHTFSLKAPLPKERRDALFAELDRHASPGVAEAFRTAVRDLDALAGCPSCGREGRLTPWSDARFHARCGSCGSSWEIREQGGRRILVRRPEGKPEGTDPSAWAGRDWDEFDLPVSTPAGRRMPVA